MAKHCALAAVGMLFALAAAASASAALINTYAPSNITPTVSGELSIGLAVDMINGNGFLGAPPNFTDADFDIVPEHAASSPIVNDMWLDVVGVPANAWASFDLGSIQTLDFMRVWNYNQSTATGRGVNSANVYYSTAASPGLPGGDALNPALSGWTQLGSGPLTFTQATGLATYDAVDDISFGGVQARHVLIDIISNFGTIGDNVGLSEVQFFSLDAQVIPVPEPSTLALLALAGVVGLTRRRRS
jgi:hypothetical protein